MDRIVTTSLDVLGLLLVAAGVFWITEPLFGGGALLCSGAVVLVGSALADIRPWARRKDAS